MQERYSCSNYAEIISVSKQIISDMDGVPEDITEDLEQEFCLYFLQRHHLKEPLEIELENVYGILTDVCRRYTGSAHMNPDLSMNDEAVRYFNFCQ